MAGSREASGPDSLRHEAWVEDLKAQQGFHQVVTAGALLANNTLLPPEHMVSFVPVLLIIITWPRCSRAEFQMHMQ